ncbi:MAG: choice-of-anchor Q domain-containing protein [Saprospiraceae bacterium]
MQVGTSLVYSANGSVGVRDTGGWVPNNPDTDVDVAPSQFLLLHSTATLLVNIDGLVANTSYPQLKVTGKVYIDNASLSFAGSSYTTVGNETFEIIANDGTDNIVGTFNGLPEGAVLPNFLDAGLDAFITYAGGDGNDVVITVKTPLRYCFESTRADNAIRLNFTETGTFNGRPRFTAPFFYNFTLYHDGVDLWKISYMDGSQEVLVASIQSGLLTPPVGTPWVMEGEIGYIGLIIGGTESATGMLSEGACNPLQDCETEVSTDCSLPFSGSYYPSGRFDGRLFYTDDNSNGIFYHDLGDGARWYLTTLDGVAGFYHASDASAPPASGWEPLPGNVCTGTTLSINTNDPIAPTVDCALITTDLDDGGQPVRKVAANMQGEYQLEDFTNVAVAVDNCVTITSIVQLPEIGTVLAVGTHTITVTATDAMNNMGACYFTLVVQPVDCAGTPNGIATVDECGVCSGGDTGLVPNASCADCENVPNGPALPGTACDDADVGTLNDTWTNDCQCIGTAICDFYAGNSILYVNENATAGGDGTQWDNAFTDLQAALGVAAECPNVTQIWVAAGTYKPTADANRNKSFVMSNNLAIYGGFDGTETQLSERNWVTNATILSGDLNGDDVVTGSGNTLSFANNGENSYHVIYNNDNGLNNTAVLDGFTITGGNSTISYPLNYGGGMANIKASPMVINCIFVGNAASFAGGGMYNEFTSTATTVVNCMFLNNKAVVGGGVSNLGSNVLLTNCTFFGNLANTGGGIDNLYTPDPRLENCIIWGNSSGIANESCNAIVTYSIVQGGYPDVGNLNVDPLFVDDANGDFRLQDCSPAIDAGTNTNAPAIDLDANPRPVNATELATATVDMGAYEFQTIAYCPDLYISGRVVWEHDRATPVTGVMLGLSGDDDIPTDVTDAAGLYSLFTDGGNVTVTPTKNDNPRNGVDAADVLRIKQHVLGITPLNNGFKTIAADVNETNTVTNADAVIIQQALLGSAGAGNLLDNPAWAFVDSAHVFANANAPWGYPSTSVLANMAMDTVVNFVGVKMGDVDGTWGTSTADLQGQSMTWLVEDVLLEAGQNRVVTFRAGEDMADVAAWQFALRVNPAYATIQRTVPSVALPLQAEDFNIHQSEVRSVYAQAKGQSLQAGAVVFQLEIAVHQGGVRLSEILTLDDDSLTGKVYDTVLLQGRAKLVFERKEE